MIDHHTAELGVLTPADRADLQDLARTELRRLLRGKGDAGLLQGIDAIGYDEIEAASDLAVRLDAVAPATRADALLDEMNRLVSSVYQPPRRRNFFGLAADVVPIERRLRAAEPALARLVEELACERDRLAQRAVSAQRLGERLSGAELALERVAHLLVLLAQGVEAAGRELTRDDPARARFVGEAMAARVLERTQDVLTQLAVLHQAQMSLRLILDGQQSLVRAVDRTRLIMVSALRTAVSAMRAIEDGTRMAGRTAALDEAAARRSLDGSLEEMRNALAER